MIDDADIVGEVAQHLVRIQNACREYPTQPGEQRRMTFATIRIAADAIATLADDSMNDRDANDVRKQVIAITSSVDDLSNLFGSDDADRCKACSKQLNTIQMGRGNTLSYCVHCPSEMLEAVREISDLTGADVL